MARCRLSTRTVILDRSISTPHPHHSLQLSARTSRIHDPFKPSSPVAHGSPAATLHPSIPSEPTKLQKSPQEPAPPSPPTQFRRRWHATRPDIRSTCRLHRLTPWLPL